MHISKLKIALLWTILTISTWRHVNGRRGNGRVGKLVEVFAWQQLTYNINGSLVLRDRFSGEDLNGVSSGGQRNAADNVFFDNNDGVPDRQWDKRPTSGPPPNDGRTSERPWFGNNFNRPATPTPPTPTTRPTQTNNASADANSFFIQYNNLPMGVEKHGNRLFITVPRRRYGVPSTLNYLDLTTDSNTRSPALRPYPNLRDSRQLVSVYRTRIDSCNRLWMVDTGLLEIPNNPQRVQQPSIVIYDLNTDRMIRRYELKDSDLPQANTATGLASITVEVLSSCEDTFAYIPDLTTYGIITYSMQENDSWRVTHNYFHFNPVHGNLNIAGLRFQWDDGIFSITLSAPNSSGCRAAYFHPMASIQEFTVSTCVLRNRTASADSGYWENYSMVGERGENSQCTMHGYHAGTRVLFFAEIGRSGVSCWSTSLPLTPANMALVGQDTERLSYPADLHVTDDEVWVLSNSLPRFIYSRLDTNQYNFFIYRATVQSLISGTVCESGAAASMNFLQ